MNNEGGNAAIEVLDSERKRLERRLADIKKAMRTLRGSNSPMAGDGNQPVTSDVTLDILKRSEAPLTAREIAEQVAKEIDGITEGAVSACITRLKNKGLIQTVSDGNPKRWIAASASQPSDGMEMNEKFNHSLSSGNPPMIKRAHSGFSAHI